MIAVVGHLEWVSFAVAARLPQPGEILHAREGFATVGGGGAVAAVQLARLTGACTFFTSVGTGPAGERALAALSDLGVTVHAARPAVPQREALTHLTDDHERTITVLGARHVPAGADPLPWAELADADAVYFTGGDASALAAARQARVLVATPRARGTLCDSGLELDALVASGSDPGEAFDPAAFTPPPRHVVLTAGAQGGTWTGADGTSGAWAAATPDAPPVDAYGCGDTFAAALALGLGEGHTIDAALELAARCGAACLTGRGPYGRPLTPALLRRGVRPEEG